MIIQKYVKIGERGQLTIPLEIRKEEGIEPKQIVRVINISGDIKIMPLKKDKEPEEDILDILQSVNLGKDAWGEIQKERER